MTYGLDFRGKTVVVVGGSSGIGNAIAQAFRGLGGRVVVWGTRPSLADYAAEPGSDLTGLEYSQLDVTDAQTVLGYVAPFDSLDVLILSQGVSRFGRQEFEIDTFRKVVDLNLVSVMSCATRFEADLKASRGSLIILNSTAAYATTSAIPAYNASKAGLLGLTRALAQNWGRHGVRVNGIAPGMVATRMTRIATGDPERLAAYVARVPQGRIGAVEDVAGVALFLASDLAGHIVGQTIIVDGGMTLG